MDNREGEWIRRRGGGKWRGKKEKRKGEKGKKKKRKKGKGNLDIL
jgi:hypothetical protein